MSHSFPLVLATCSLFVSVPGTALAQSTATSRPDSSAESRDPKNTVVAFYSALASQDAEKASRFVLQADKMNDWLKSQAELSAAFTRWNEVIAAKLGESGSSLIMPNPIEWVADRSREIDARVKGNTAEFPVTDKNPLKLRRVDEQWKLDIFSAYEKPEMLKLLGVSKAEEALALITLKAREESKMLRVIATEVNMGRLATPNDVRQRMRTERDAMHQRILDAMSKAARQNDGREPE